MRYLLAVLVAVGMSVPSVQAGFYYDAQGKTVITNEPYDGPGMTPVDLAAVGGLVGGLLWSSIAIETVSIGGLAATSFGTLAYGAWRTNKYRPTDVQAAIHARVTAKQAAATYARTHTMAIH